MAKKSQKKVAAPPKIQPQNKFSLTATQQWLIALGLLFLIILIYFFPIVFENKVPPSTDIIAWKGNAESILEARKLHSYTPLWANNIFSGMPAHLISLWPPFEQPARYLVDGLALVFKWQSVYYLLGALGMLLLLRFWNLSITAAAFSAAAFVWWPNLIGMLEAGHNGKVQTIMLLPLVLFLFLRMMRKANLLNFVLLSIAFSLAVRAGHYQIVFYAVLAMAFFAIVQLFQLIKEKRIADAGLRVGLIVLALGLGAAMSAFHALQVREYSKYSIRGGTGEEGSSGLDMNYATQWSLHPGEMYNFIIPHFWGGSSSQLYTGDAVPQLKNRVIPGYWGHMPFTSTTDYLGVVAVFFALLGIAYGWKRTEVKILVALLIFSLLMAFGRHFPVLYRLFFEWAPFFNKFRVPTMIVVLVMFCNAALAGVGLNILLTTVKEIKAKTLLTGAAVVFGLLLLLGVVPLLLRNSLSFSRPDDVRYGEQILPYFKTARFDLLKGDALRMLALAAAAFGLIAAYIKKVLPRSLFAGLVLVLLLVDLLTIDKRYMQQLISKSQLDDYFAETELDRFFLQDQEPHRIYPIGELADEAHWPYFHQSIEGYHPAKLRIYQDIRDSCLSAGKEFGGTRPSINWNVVNMLNAKYLISTKPLSYPNLLPVDQENDQKLLVYRNNAALPRAFCVGAVEVISDREARLNRLNQASFKPDSVAILEHEPQEPIARSHAWSTKITRYEPNYIDVQATTDAQTLLVLSEIYYPAGWKAVVNGSRKEIYKVNHILRGVVVPAGESTVSFKLEPHSYKTSVAVTAGSGAIVYLLLIIALYPQVQVLLKKRQTTRA
jgi:hypothetical protein